jgi:TonB family protein
MYKLLLIIFLLMSIVGVCQTTQTIVPIVCESTVNPQELPEYPGGMNALYDFIKTNIKYPTVITEKGIYGTCYVRYTVDIDGSIKDVKILKGVKDCPECDEEAKRVISIMPNWIPGKINGKASSTFFNLPIKFKAQ